jgi:hypothetical protein
MGTHSAFVRVSSPHPTGPPSVEVRFHRAQRHVIRQHVHLVVKSAGPRPGSAVQLRTASHTCPIMFD